MIDLLEYAVQLSPHLLNALVEPEPGLYLRRTLKPCFSYNKKYYTAREHSSIPFGLLTRIDDDIVDKDFNIVVTRQQLNFSKKYMLAYPDIPVTAIKLIIELVKSDVRKLAPYSAISGTGHLDEFIKLEYLDIISDNEYREELEVLLDMVFDFVHNDPWHIYFIQIVNTTMMIKKTVDFRIYTYHLNQQRQINDGYS